MSVIAAAIYAMAKKRNPPDALLFKIPPEEYGDLPPVFLVVASDRVPFWLRFGWILLADERSVRWADIDVVRRDEERGNR